MKTIHINELGFTIDRAGAQIANAREVRASVSYEDIALDEAEDPAAEIGKRLSQLFGEDLDDEEGHFDFEVTQNGSPVAALMIACEEDDDAIFIGGERVESVTDKALASALTILLSPDFKPQS